MTDQEKIQAIGALTQSLAYVQEVTYLGKQDPSDLASPIVPQYVFKKPVVEGKLRINIEAALNTIVIELAK